MKRPWIRALQGLVLSTGSPLGWLALRWLGGAAPGPELAANPGIYLYLTLGTAFAFTGFGWYLGLQEARQREKALHDALTGLYNPRYFRERLEEECAFAARHGRPLSLLIGDIDWFKKVNDTWGHSAGDRVLVAVAGALMSLRRRGDTVARVGGEEFGLILPETGRDEACRVAERLREAVAALRFDSGTRSGAYAVTVSFGAAEAGADCAPARLYEQADAALYRAKRTGRNRVVASGGPPAAVADRSAA